MKVRDLLTTKEKVKIKYSLFLMKMSLSKKKYIKRRNNIALIIRNALGRVDPKA